MLDFTRKSARRFHLPWKDLPERRGDHWKIDVMMFGRIPMLLIVHEQTLFTLVRRKSDFKTPELLADEIRLFCRWYRSPGEIIFGRNSDRRLTGSITDMKRITWGMEFSHKSIKASESMINDCPFVYLREKESRRFHCPLNAVICYEKGELPWLK